MKSIDSLKIRTAVVFILLTFATAQRGFASSKGESGIGLHLGLGTHGGGDTGGQMPHSNYYRLNYVSSSGIEGNLSPAMQTVGIRWRVNQKLDFGAHGGLAALSDGLSARLRPATYFSVHYQPFCFWVCLGIESLNGLSFNSFQSKPNVVPVSSFTLGLYLWF